MASVVLMERPSSVDAGAALLRSPGTGLIDIPLAVPAGRRNPPKVSVLMQRVRNQPEFLDAPAGIDLAGINVALAVDRHGVNGVKLPGVAAVMPETADDAAVLALQDPDFVVLAIGVQQISLFRIRPDRDIPCRAAAERVLLIDPLLHEAAVLPEH